MNPNEHGYFGIFGGRYVPETLVPVIEDLTEAYSQAKADKTFWANSIHCLSNIREGRRRCISQNG